MNPRRIDKSREQKRDRDMWTTREWFRIAVVVTLGAIGFAGLLLYGMFASPTKDSLAAESSMADKEPFVVMVARTPGGATQWIAYARALDALQAELGRPIQVRYVRSRMEVGPLFASGAVDAGFIPTRCYIDLYTRGVVRAVVAPVIDHHVRDAATLVVREQSRTISVEGLRGARVGVTSEPSLAGSAYLFWLLDDIGEDPIEFLEEVVLASSQSLNLTALVRGEIDATVVNRSQLADWGDGLFRVVSTSDEYGMPPFVVRTGISEAVERDVIRALTRMDATSLRSRSVLQGFAVVTDADYAFARELGRFSPGNCGIEVSP